MKLSLLLFALSVKLRTASRHNALLRARLQQRTASVWIQTEDHRVGRLFVFAKGRIFTRSGGEGEADVTMLWKDASIAFAAMTSNDPQAIAKALETGHLRLVGDVMVAQWFASVIQALKGPAPLPAIAEKVAVIGLGKMGAGLAYNIQKNGFPLVVFNRTAAKAQEFVERGALLAQNPREAAEQATVILSSLMDDRSVRDIVTAPDGILAGMKPGSIHLCATTISPELAKELTEIHRQHGCYFVSGAVVGRPDFARAGELITLLAGASDAVERCKPICNSYSSTVMVLGEDPALANYAKLSINYFAASNMELMGQIYAYGDAVGIDRAFYGRLFETSFSNPTLKMYATKIGDRAFQTEVGFELSGGIKDLKLMHAASQATSRSLNYAPLIIEKMQTALDRGWEHYDWCSFTDMSLKDGH
ncbi:NAD(P)-binding domain-containing protein [Martelella sp. HB161492]|uniref:NAD(P)-binding domain-containing protein n=1 Tax=Martelella sp. HB161492 TaxID=2720726 RepID=UPI001591699B|nr:NAD(P)-binding domain-containing protein [Martelella sp. HB161492]